MGVQKEKKYIFHCIEHRKNEVRSLFAAQY